MSQRKSPIRKSLTGRTAPSTKIGSSGAWSKTGSKGTSSKTGSKGTPSKTGSSSVDEPGSSPSDRADRAFWKGAITFGLVQVQVGIVSAERANELSFHQLDRRDNSPIGYERINKRTGAKVAWGQIVKGYEISKGHFVAVTDEDFEKANVAASQTIDIQDFVDGSKIPPAYFVRPYDLIPDKKSVKAYALLRDVMVARNLFAVALVVIRTRQHLCAVIPRGDHLELELLRFAHELREPTSRSGDRPKATPRELELAEQLIDKMISPWEPKKYKDTYRDDLVSAIREKAETGAVKARHVPAVAVGGTTDLVEILQRSMRAAHKERIVRERPAAKNKAA